MKRMEFEQLAQQVLEGTCEGDDFERLEAELRSSGEMRRLFRETFLLDGMLGHAAEESQGGHPEAEAIVGMEDRLRRQRRRAVSIAVAAAAAMVATLAVALHFIWLEPAPMLSMRMAPHTVCAVRAPDGSPADAARLEAGDEIRVDAGTVELSFGDGVRGIVQGPARMVVEGPGRLGLSYGTGRFEVPEGADGFTVRSRRLDVVDLGTAFGVVVAESDSIPPEVHVFDGRVRASAIGGFAESSEFQAGEAARVTAVGRLEPIEPKPSRFFTELPDDLPFVRLDFEPGDGGGFRVSGTHPAVPGMMVRGEGRVERVDGIRGRAVRFAEPGARVVTSWDGTLGDAPRTLSAWVRIPPEREYQQYQTVAGWGDPTIGRAGKCELLMIRPRPGGPTLPRLSFDQFLFTGTSDLADGRWHHLAAVYDGGLGDARVRDRVRLYVDGLPEPWHPVHTQVGELPREPSTREGGVPLVVGDLPLGEQRRTFQGAIDEVVVFEAALDEARIRRLAGRE